MKILIYSWLIHFGLLMKLLILAILNVHSVIMVSSITATTNTLINSLFYSIIYISLSFRNRRFGNGGFETTYF